MQEPVESIFHAVEYIEAHLQTEVTVAQIADAAGYSLFHFIRTFNRLVHHTPYDYLTRRRLSEAAKALAATERRIIDIAQDFCFENQESFSRAFKRMFRVPPSLWREVKPHNADLLTPPITQADLDFINRKDFRPPRVVTLPKTTLHGLMTRLDVDEADLPALRKRLFMDICGAASVAQIPEYVTVLSRSGPAYLFAGIELPKGHAAQRVLAVKTLPAGIYVRVGALAAQRILALRYLYHTWCPAVGQRPAFDLLIEVCSAEKDPDAEETIYLPLESA